MCCQPSEAYLTLYLKTVNHLTTEQLDNDVWPYDTYGSFAFLLPVGVLAEVAGYKVAIMSGLLCRELTRVLLLWASSVDAMAGMQLTYACATASNTVYFAYVYMCVPQEYFVRVTALIHMAYYAGNALGSLLGQILYSYAGFDDHLEGLFYLSWGFTTIGLIVFLLGFPPQIRESPPSLAATLLNKGWKLLFDTLREMYSDSAVLVWSAWWLMGLGSHSMIANYYQTQFCDVDPSIGSSLGYVEAIMMLLSAFASMLPSVIPPSALIRLSIPVILSSSLALSFAYYAATVWQQTIYYVYGFNIFAISLFSFQYATGSAVIASQITEHRYAILFTANSFVSYGLSTIIQQVGQHKALSTSDYFRIAAVQQLVAVLLVILVMLVIRGGHCNLIMNSKQGSDEELEEQCRGLGYHRYESVVPTSS